MKDLRDLIGVIEEGQYAFDDSQPYFDGVWDAFKRLANLSVPDAVITPSPSLIEYQAKRYRVISSNQKSIKNKKKRFDDMDRDDDDSAILDDETTFAKLSNTNTKPNSYPNATS